jgi:hypothetical protein
MHRARMGGHFGTTSVAYVVLDFDVSTLLHKTLRRRRVVNQRRTDQRRLPLCARRDERLKYDRKEGAAAPRVWAAARQLVRVCVGLVVVGRLGGGCRTRICHNMPCREAAGRGWVRDSWVERENGWGTLLCVCICSHRYNDGMVPYCIIGYACICHAAKAGVQAVGWG